MLQNEFLIDSMRHQFQVNAHFNNYHVGLAEDIIAMAARLNIDERVRKPSDLPKFEKKSPSNPFDKQCNSDEEEE